MTLPRGSATLRRNLKQLNNLEQESLWNQIYRQQVAYFSSHDMSLFHNLDSWQRASRVLEVGCGNGAFLKKLCERYPDKSYTAIDHSYEALQQARRTLKAHSVRIFQDDIYNFDLGLERVDFIILRFIAQDLPDLSLVMRKLRSLLKPSGTVLIIESNDELASIVPHSRQLNALLSHLKRTKDPGRTPAIRQISSAADRMAFRQVRRQVGPVSAVTSEEKRRFRQLMLTVSEMINRQHSGPVDQMDVYRQLKAWQKDVHSYAQLGVEYLVFEKVDSRREYAIWCHTIEKARIFKKLGSRRFAMLLAMQIEHLTHERKHLASAYCLLELALKSGVLTKVRKQLQENTWTALAGFAAVPTFPKSKAEILSANCKDLYQICRDNGWKL